MVQSISEALSVLEALSTLNEHEWIIHPSSAGHLCKLCGSAGVRYSDYVIHTEIGAPQEVKRYVITNE